MAKIPAAIQKEIDAAEEIERMLAEQSQPEASQELPVETPPVEDPAPAPTDLTPAPVEETWEQKYRILQGKYDAEVPRLYAQVRELTDNLNQLSTRLQSQLDASPVAPQSEVAPEDVEAFGEDLVNLARRIAAAEADRRVSAAMQRVDQVEGRVQETEKDRFYTILSTRVPNWNDVNRDQGWLQWLGEYDPIAGVNRQAALDSAANAMDADRVAAIFNSYLLTRQQIPVAAPSVPASTLQEQVVPRSQGVSNATPTGKRVFTETEAKELLSMRNMRRLSPEQQNALELELEQAWLEGRVVST